MRSSVEVTVVVWVVVLVVVDMLVAVLVDVLVDVSVVLMPDSYTVVEANTIVSTTKRPSNAVLTFNLSRDWVGGAS